MVSQTFSEPINILWYFYLPWLHDHFSKEFNLNPDSLDVCLKT